MNRRKFFNRIVLEEIDEGLLVQQGEEAYVARNWCLSAPVVELVETAMEAGLSWMTAMTIRAKMRVGRTGAALFIWRSRRLNISNGLWP